MPMKVANFICASVVLCLGASSLFAQQQIRTLSEYNQTLPLWGVSWSPGSDATHGYYPSFYTGFAMRSEFPERIHVRLARGNQTRVSVILDDQTLSDYLYDLAKRYDFYKEVTAPYQGERAMVRTEVGTYIPQLENFYQVLESPEYGILDFVRNSTPTSEALYDKALTVLAALNPGRVFRIELDLAEEFGKWRAQLQQDLQGEDPARYFRDDSAVIIAINQLVWGRINYTDRPSEQVMNLLLDAARQALGGSEESFVQAAYQLFLAVTGDKYQFEVLNSRGEFQAATSCGRASDCYLKYPEFSAVYPTGTAKASTSDGRGNRINQFATPGLWQFIDRRYHEVDNIRDEPYYGWAPKMDYEGIGNGFHNPAVRFYGIGDSLRQAMRIPSDHNTLWSVKRGRVSSGCARLPLGHIWEMRHIFPVENEKMKQVYFFGNNSEDFDVYDINGDGQLEVIGVEYLISYGLQGASGLAKREGTGFEINSDRKLDFYLDLYGSRDVFETTGENSYVFINPSVSLPSYMDYQRKRVRTSITIEGRVPLYEAAYEQDKVQFYAPYTTSGLTQQGQRPLSKRIVRLMGRVRGCAPQSDKAACGEAAFDQEAAEIRNEVY